MLVKIYLVGQNSVELCLLWAGEWVHRFWLIFDGALALAYAQLFSMNQVSRLAELAKYHAQQQQKEQEPDIQQLFGDDAVLRFDNL